jgi:hypothetical protein
MGWPESDLEARSELAAFVQKLRTDTRWGISADPESMHRFAKELASCFLAQAQSFAIAHVHGGRGTKDCFARRRNTPQQIL